MYVPVPCSGVFRGEVDDMRDKTLVLICCTSILILICFVYCPLLTKHFNFQCTRYESLYNVCTIRCVSHEIADFEPFKTPKVGILLPWQPFGDYQLSGNDNGRTYWTKWFIVDVDLIYQQMITRYFRMSS